MRYLIAVLMMGLLAACDLGATTPTQEPLPSVEMSAEESDDADESAEASADESEAAAMTCEEAWAEIDVTDVGTLEDLESISTQLDVTIENCESLDEWLDQAEDTIPTVDTADIESWAAERCSESDTLSESPICEEIDS